MLSSCLPTHHCILLSCLFTLSLLYIAAGGPAARGDPGADLRCDDALPHPDRQERDGQPGNRLNVVEVNRDCQSWNLFCQTYAA